MYTAPPFDLAVLLINIPFVTVPCEPMKIMAPPFPPSVVYFGPFVRLSFDTDPIAILSSNLTSLIPI